MLTFVRKAWRLGKHCWMVLVWRGGKVAGNSATAQQRPRLELDIQAPISISNTTLVLRALRAFPTFTLASTRRWAEWLT